ncbi:MAG TPA: PilZ domain-containing protein [Pirellulaceae bacterium]|nr:PilZ domain-containing protein [Pirellulaceae bacterium]
MTSTVQPEARKDGRVEIDDAAQRPEDSGDLRILVRRSSASDSNEVLDARPLDVSVSGMKLSTSGPLVFGETIELHFQSTDLDIDFAIDAEVRWIRQGDGDEAWLFGCAFATQLTNDDVDRFATAGGVDRRQWPRSDTKMQTMVQLACNPSPFCATLLDYSATGLRFTSDDAVEPNQPIRILLDDGHGEVLEIRAVSRWKMSYESGYLVGCEVGGEHRTVFERWRRGLSKAKPQDSHGRRVLSVKGCVIVAFLLALIWWISW